MKRKLAWFGAIFSGLYLLTMGPLPDPIPFIDEGIALAIFLKSSAALGYDFKKWLPFFGKSQKSKESNKKAKDKGVTIDV